MLLGFFLDLDDFGQHISDLVATKLYNNIILYFYLGNIDNRDIQVRNSGGELVRKK